MPHTAFVYTDDDAGYHLCDTHPLQQKRLLMVHRHWEALGAFLSPASFLIAPTPATEAICRCGRCKDCRLPRSLLQEPMYVPVPNDSTLCRRRKKMTLALSTPAPEGPLHLVVDGMGLKVFGDGKMLFALLAPSMPTYKQLPSLGRTRNIRGKRTGQPGPVPA